MEIRFSKPLANPWTYLGGYAAAQGARAKLTNYKGASLRFQLQTSTKHAHNGYTTRTWRAASPEIHDRVIRALLTLDPDATVRTARAVYEGLKDFEKQRGKV